MYVCLFFILTLVLFIASIFTLIMQKICRDEGVGIGVVRKRKNYDTEATGTWPAGVQYGASLWGGCEGGQPIIPLCSLAGLTQAKQE